MTDIRLIRLSDIITLKSFTIHLPFTVSVIKLIIVLKILIKSNTQRYKNSSDSINLLEYENLTLYIIYSDCKASAIQSSWEVERGLVLKEKRQCTAHALLNIKRSLIKTHIYSLEINLFLEKKYELSSFPFITSYCCIIFRSEIIIILISL